MLSDSKLLNIVTKKCVLVVTLIVLGSLNELNCNEHALDFQKNSKITNEVQSMIQSNDCDVIYGMFSIKSLNSQFQFVSFGQSKRKM